MLSPRGRIPRQQPAAPGDSIRYLVGQPCTPLISPLTSGEEITVARPFYDQVNGPLMLALVFLMGVGPMLPWRKANWASVRRALAVPAGVAVLAVVALLALGISKPYAVAGFGLAAFVASGILMEWYRGARARHRNSQENYAAAFLHLVWANPPALWRLHRSPVRADGDVGHRRHLFLQRPEGCRAVPRRDHHYRQLRNPVSGHNRVAFRQPHRVHFIR